MDLVEEAAIVHGLYSLNCEMFNGEDVRTFLITNVPEKKVVDRFIAWGAQLRILPISRQKWGTALHLMSKNYIDQCGKNFAKHPDDPLLCIPTEFDVIIRHDLQDTNTWFHQICRECGIPDADLTSAFDRRLARIYAALTLDQQDSRYTAGLVRIGCVCLAMTTVFSRCARLPFDFGESIAFYFTRSVLSLIPARRLPLDAKKPVAHFENIDQAIRTVRPVVFDVMVANKTGSIAFGMTFEMFLFATEHLGVAILNIWDQIFARLESLPEFVQALTIAHVMQMQIEEKDGRRKIKEKQRWDVERLIADACRILTHERSCRESFCLYFCPFLKMFHGYEVFHDW
jgi:hypothetical protein